MKVSSKMDTKIPKLKIKVSTPTEILYEGEADSVSSVNSQGKFDILPLHANFVTLVKGEPINVKLDKREKQFSFKNAIIHTSENLVRVYAEVSK